MLSFLCRSQRINSEIDKFTSLRGAVRANTKAESSDRLRLLIDHTGLQSAGLCLARQARDEIDVRGLLQLATLLIFADELVLNGFAADRVAIKSEVTLKILRDLGLDHEALEIQRPDEDCFVAACDRAAWECADAVKFAFWPQRSSEVGLSPPALGTNADKGFRHLLKNLRKRPSPEFLARVKETLSSGDYVRAVDHMIVANEDLRCAVLSTVDEHGWSDEVLYQLRAFLRSQLYQELAHDAKAKYTPAVARAKLNRSHYHQVDSLGDKVDVVVSKLREVPLKVPSVHTALIKLSKSEPRALIEEALALRMRATPIRKELSAITKHPNQDTPKGRAQSERKIKEIVVDLEHSLKESGSDRRQNALSLICALIGFRPGHVPKVVQWVEQRWRANRVSVLTDLSIVASDPIDVYEDYAKLKRACGLSKYGGVS